MDASVIEAADMEMAVCIAALALLARYDLRARRLPLGLLLAANTVGLIFAVMRNGTSPAAYLGDLGAGAFVLLLSAVSRGRIGSGDGLCLTAVGLICGGVHCCKVFFAGLALCAVCGGILLLRRKGRDAELPFVPFLLAAEIIFIAGELI